VGRSLHCLLWFLCRFEQSVPAPWSATDRLSPARRSPAHRAGVVVSAILFRQSRGLCHTSLERHPLEQSISSDELVVERGKHVQNDEAAQEHRKKDVGHKGRISHQGGR